MKTPQQLADEKAMEIAKELKLRICTPDYIKSGPVSSEIIEDAKLISTHLLPLYECVEALRKSIPCGNHSGMPGDVACGQWGSLCSSCKRKQKALSNLSTPTTEKKESE